MGEGKHKKDPKCPGCYPERTRVLAAAQRRRIGGYSPLPKCEAHTFKFKLTPGG